MLVLLGTVSGSAQVDRGGFAGAVSGLVKDASTQKPVEYANVILLSGRDSTQVTGTITDMSGAFDIRPVRPGRYYLQVRFMGYESRDVEEIVVTPGRPQVDVGTIFLDPAILLLDGVSVEGEKPAITFAIDKKVIAVSEMPTAVSGNAVDVLENVPSVTVDIEGNVTLRGSSNFTVLIDGRPTVLDAADALQQTPASAIENIEIITNPSVKYDPEGTAGIINLVMKKGQQNGLRGMANANIGLRGKYGGDVLLESRRGKFGFTFGVDYRRFTFQGSRMEENETVRDGLRSYIYSNGDDERKRRSSGLRGSIDFQMTPSDFLTLNMRAGRGSGGSEGVENFEKWAEPDNVHEITRTFSERDRSSDYYSSNLTYLHRFGGPKGHELQSQLSYQYRDGDEYTLHEEFDQSGVQINGRKTTESGPSGEIEFKLDYTLPMTESRKFEAGYDLELNAQEEDNGLHDYSTEEMRLIYQPEYSNKTKYDRRIDAIYAIYADKWMNLGMQAGFRTEYTGRHIEIVETGETFEIDRWDYFPSLHMSYQFPGNHQVMASYTRRINRPRGYFLEPFETWTDAYNVRKGNPALEPEYINAWESGYQTNVGKNLFSLEAYYRHTENTIERVRSVYAPNVTLQTVENIGEEFAFGSEMMLNMDLVKSWNVNLMGNLYQYRVEGRQYDEDFSKESLNWNIHLNQMFRLLKTTQVQFNTRYVSPSVRAQGTREGFFMSDLAFKQEFLNRDLTVTLQIRDIFGTGKFEFTSEGPDFYIYDKFTRETPFVMLNIRYAINHYKPDRRQPVENGINGTPSEDEF